MPAADFHDITSGNNNGYSAGPGYDMVTGIGSPVANKLVPGFVPVTSKGTVAFAAHSYEIGTSATITVGDLDLAGNPSCPVTLTSSAGDSETMNLPALGGGVFKGSIVISGASATPGDGILETVPGGTITVTYNDANDGTGHPAVVTDQATTYKVGHYTFTTIGSRDGRRAVFGDRYRLRYRQQSDPRLQRHGLADGLGRGRRAVDQPNVGHVCLRRVDGQHHRQRGGSERGGAVGQRKWRPWARATCLRRSPVRSRASSGARSPRRNIATLPSPCSSSPRTRTDTP